MDVCDFLTSNGIPFERFDHPAVFTCEESALLAPMPGADTKNLFLTEDRGDRSFLVTVGHNKRVDLKGLCGLLGIKRLSFGSPEELRASLGVDPGSVTLLGLACDTEHRVDVVIDRPIWDAPSVQCHPLVNTATLIIPHTGLETFLARTGHTPRIIDVPER
ncbi:MAG: prolyl-tRNA synthetase [Candidatus Peregrinibacteria bacterium Gr01-1014_25]|nr:MAG: prolyl-tRNA synthetase [Candidatus Peregrinibacteria bacterium Gr01-1014_25]